MRLSLVIQKHFQIFLLRKSRLEALIQTEVQSCSLKKILFVIKREYEAEFLSLLTAVSGWRNQREL